MVGLLCLAAMVTWTGTAAQSPSVSPKPGTGRLAEAFWLLPPSGSDVAFTDWDRIRASQGAQELTGDSSLDDKVAFLMATSLDEAAASGYALARLRGHRDAWGFDTLDLDWEATYSADGPPVFVLRFRDGFDLAPVAARFDERGFSTTEQRGAVIRSHEMDPSADWLSTTEFAILNTAFLDDGRTLVLSSGLDGLEAVLRGRYRRGPLTPPAIRAILAALDGASAAWLAVGPGTCLAFTMPPLDIGDPRASLRPMPSAPVLHPYTVLGVAYERPGWDPIGRIAMGFFDDDSAQADAAARVELARTGLSLRARVPYSEAVFTVEDSRVQDHALVLEVAPKDDQPRRLFDMVFARDMSFAGC